MRTKLLIALLLLGSTAEGGSKRVERPPPIAAVRIRQVRTITTEAGRTEVTSVQSGCVIWKHANNVGLILTCAHGLDDQALAHLLLSPTELAWGRIIAIDKERDLALIQAPIPANITPLKMAAFAPETGDATIVGFGGGWWDNDYLERKTKIDGLTDRAGHKYLKLATGTRNGDSGGPVISNGEVIGVHVRSDNRTFSLEVPIDDVHKFLVDKAGWKRP